MYLNRITSIVLACMLVAATLSLPASAAEADCNAPSCSTTANAIPRATQSFDLTVPAGASIAAGEPFSLLADEVVTIEASYYPANASMDFGLLDSDGVFHYVRTTSGQINQEIAVEKNGQYILLIRNNYRNEVNVNGFVNY